MDQPTDDQNKTNKPVPVPSMNTPTVVQKDPVLIELERQRLIAKRQRQSKIGNLLDKATEYLGSVIDSTDPGMREDLKVRAAEAAVKLYTEQGKIDVAEDTIRVKEQQLDLERQKLNAPLFQQNNLYLGQPQQQPSEDDSQQLLLRKKAQDAILQSFLPSNHNEGEDDDAADVLTDEDNNNEDDDT